MSATFYTYCLASRPYGTPYIGVTNGLIRRVDDHRSGTASKFTLRYQVHRLVWYQASLAPWCEPIRGLRSRGEMGPGDKHRDDRRWNLLG